jgi:hypothetical protein
MARQIQQEATVTSQAVVMHAALITMQTAAPAPTVGTAAVPKAVAASAKAGVRAESLFWRLIRKYSLPASFAWCTFYFVALLLAAHRHVGVNYVLELRPPNPVAGMVLWPLTNLMNLASRCTVRTVPRGTKYSPTPRRKAFAIVVGVLALASVVEVLYMALFGDCRIPLPGWLPVFSRSGVVVVAANAAACAAMLAVQLQLWCERRFGRDAS